MFDDDEDIVAVVVETLLGEIALVRQGEVDPPP